jgi:hypothetical protein
MPVNNEFFSFSFGKNGRSPSDRRENQR